MGDDDNLNTCVLSYGLAGYDGPGWYYWDEEYPSDGSAGAWATWEEAADHAVTCGYVRPKPTDDDIARSSGAVLYGDVSITDGGDHG